MKQINTKGIVLSRINYGEADRIVTLLTPDQGKLRLMAKGVRRVKSKLAGGIELFSISEVTYIEGKGEVGTLISSRMDQHYGQIIKDIERVQLGYELIKQVNKVTEDNAEKEYFMLLIQAFEALDEPSISLELINIWFQAQLLKLSGHSPNLSTDAEGSRLVEDKKYNFDTDNMAFIGAPRGRYRADHIKLMRLLMSTYQPAEIHTIQNISPSLKELQPLVGTLSAMMKN